MKNSVLLLIAFCALLTADTLLVPSEYPSIQSAISASQDGDTVLVSPGEYGGPISFQGKNIVVMSTGGPENTLIRTFMDFHCVMFTGGEDSTAVLEGFTLRNQISDGAVSGKQEIVDHGGGLYITNSSPTIQNNIIKDCLANTGAGVYLENSSMFMTDCTVYNNNTWVYGGGIFIGSSNGNNPPCIIDCTITNNEAQYGGGLYIWGDTAVVINNNISDNYSDHHGGGIGISSTNVLLCGNYISGNNGGNGGGVFIAGSSATFIGNIIVENQAGTGGGVDSYAYYFLMENNTVCMNTAISDPYGTGGLRIVNCDTAFVTNDIIWGNQAPNGTVPNILIYDTYITISYSNISGGIDSIWVDPTSTLNWGPGNIDIDPQFEVGPLGDYHLSYGSPCIDAGNPAWEYNDPEDPFNPGYALWPAMGTTRNDMGAFGGGGVNYWLSVEEEDSPSPETALVLKSFPNPFSSSCTVCYQLTQASHVVLSVFDLSGRLVETLVDEVVPEGMYSEYLDGTGLCSGMYLIRLVAGEHTASWRCIIVRDE
jgi:hypothetical protein